MFVGQSRADPSLPVPALAAPNPPTPKSRRAPEPWQLCREGKEIAALTLSDCFKIKSLEASRECRGINDIHAVLTLTAPVQGHPQRQHGHRQHRRRQPRVQRDVPAALHVCREKGKKSQTLCGNVTVENEVHAHGVLGHDVKMCPKVWILSPAVEIR